MVSVEKHLQKLNDQFKKNEKYIIDNPDLPIKTIIETYKTQVQLEQVIGWVMNIQNYHNPKLIKT